MSGSRKGNSERLTAYGAMIMKMLLLPEGHGELFSESVIISKKNRCKNYIGAHTQVTTDHKCI